MDTHELTQLSNILNRVDDIKERSGLDFEWTVEKKLKQKEFDHLVSHCYSEYKYMSTYKKIYIHQHHACFYCSEKTDFSEMEKEHVFPRSKGGRGIKNKVLSCHYCNNLKSDLTISEFKEKIELMMEDGGEYYNKLCKIHEKLSALENGQAIRSGWHGKVRYKSDNINKKPM